MSTPINPPAVGPTVESLKSNGKTIACSVREVGSERRGKPVNVAFVAAFTFIGEEPPADVRAWTFEGDVGRTDFTIELPASVPAGAKVWACFQWKTARGLVSPASEPQAVYLGGGVSSSAA